MKKSNALETIIKSTVNKTESRPALKSVALTKDGSLYATDSHVAIHVSDYHKLPIKETVTFDPIAYQFTKNVRYPEIAQLFGGTSNEPHNELEIKLADLKTILPMLKAYSKASSTELVKLETTDNDGMLTVSIESNKSDNVISKQAISAKVIGGNLFQASYSYFTPTHLYQLLNPLIYRNSNNDSITYYQQHNELCPALFKINQRTDSSCEHEKLQFEYLIAPVKKL